MIIQVKQEHIDKGIRMDCDSCPIALAVNDAIGRPYHCEVTTHFVEIDSECYTLPSVARYFILDFDNLLKDPKWLEPFEFELDYWPEERE